MQKLLCQLTKEFFAMISVPDGTNDISSMSIAIGVILKKR